MTHPSSVPSPSLPSEDETGIYLDNAATTPICTPARQAVLDGMTITGNPSSRHEAGDHAKEALDASREQLAALLNCTPAEVVFTAGGSESDALAICGTVLAAEQPVHLITTAIEHSAVLEACELARKLGAEVTIVNPDGRGWIDPDTIRQALRPNTALISVMQVNNETGVIQPISEIAAIAHQAGALLHTDAVQAAGKLPIPAEADLVSVSAHKFYGPKGIGALKVADHVRLAPLIRGGSQERGLRAGTENVPGILGMAAAARTALAHLDDPAVQAHRYALRDALLRGLGQAGDFHINGDGAPTLPDTLNISFTGLRGDTLVDVLAVHGVCVSAGSACHAGSDSPSHVLTAMGIPPEQAKAAIRFSTGHTTTLTEVEEAARLTVAAVGRLRALGPITPQASRV
ncbi:cysteine desulfurase family protein [Streptomyces sp. NPDC048411]|uniref:cysteine desulfurase family protein n=1 Tax=Streptomyces sp. NPDC048411 TaxID=3157206 RepID=UPI0034538410